MKKEEFKLYVKSHPNLIDYVIKNKITWQQLYEIYDLYGENDSIWNNFKEEKSSKTTNPIKEILNMFKDIDQETITKTISSINQIINAFKGDKNMSNNIYEERPNNKYFED